MKNYFLLFCLLGLFLPATGQSDFDRMLNERYKKTVDFIQPDSLQKIIKAGTEFILLDIREVNEYEVSTISGAFRFSDASAATNFLKGREKNIPIIVFCTIGERSERAGELIHAL